MRNLSVLILIAGLLIGCESKQEDMTKIIFLHHSTGRVVWLGKTNPYVSKLLKKSDVKTAINKYNRKNNKNFQITDLNFPAMDPYGWKNYPFDYYNIWVKNAGGKPYMNEPTLEILTEIYDVIIFKHCYPVSKILEDTGNPNIDSEEKRLENFKLQYLALKNKMHEFPGNKFIVWTPAVHVSNNITPDEAQRTKEFYDWITNEWDEKGDNIFLWDFYMYETEGGLYLLDKYASGGSDSHPNQQFGSRIAPLFAQFIIDVVEGAVK
jgi:hypothetical protein